MHRSSIRLALLTLLAAPLLFAATAIAAPETGDDHAGDTPAHMEHAEGDAHASPTPFAGTIAQSIAAIIAFLVLLAILHKLAWKPILTGLQDREQKIREDLEQAERANQEAKQTLAEYEKKLAEAQEEARHIVDQSRQDAEKVAAQRKEEMQTELTNLRQRAEQDITAAKQQALSEIYTTVATLSTDVAQRILQREINTDDQQRLVQESLDELNRSN